MKKIDFQKATALSTATSMPVFIDNNGIKCIAVHSTDESVSTYARNVIARKPNAVVLRPIKFTKDQDGKMIATFATSSAIMKQINQINLFADNYTEAYEKIEAARERAEKAREIRTAIYKQEQEQEAHANALCSELMPIIVEQMKKFVDCHVTRGAFGAIDIHIGSTELENFIELLAHSVSE